MEGDRFGERWVLGVPHVDEWFCLGLGAFSWALSCPYATISGHLLCGAIGSVGVVALRVRFGDHFLVCCQWPGR